MSYYTILAGVLSHYSFSAFVLYVKCVHVIYDFYKKLKRVVTSKVGH